MKSLTTTFFSVPTGDVSVKTGDLLIAEPFLKEKWFNRSVILLLEHNDEEGTMGVVLNLALSTTLSEVYKTIDTDIEVPVFCGGPLGHDRLFFLHTLGPEIIPESKEILPGLWLGGRFEAAVDYINSGYPHSGSIRFFIGYSSWAPGQLRNELADNTWAVSVKRIEANNLLTGEGSAYWHKIVKTLGDRYRAWQVLPGDARNN